MRGVILGFLTQADMSMYELRAAVQKSVNFFYSASFGSLHPALMKLKREGLIRQAKRGARGKVAYSITPAGRRAHAAWLSSEIVPGRLQEEGLLRLFFMAPMPRSEQIRVLRGYLEKLKVNLSMLRAAGRSARKRTIPADKRDWFEYQMLTLDFGLRVTKLECDWYAKVIQRIERRLDQEDRV